ncbi:hypothetical protein IEO21_02066 [Rhodonia placenta]|uniref:Uncharacterized protein n=1 Tax=Rhodonia placenta TaxID=104341 RepID=A0A8H7P877_9APHY|nr:hypothetical protein IEO21_02066 [Postia placenta]
MPAPALVLVRPGQ